MKRLLLFLLAVSVFQSKPNWLLNEKICRDVLDLIKAGIPYTYDQAKLAVEHIVIDANKIANDSFANNKTREDARRRSACAQFFHYAVGYYMCQMPLDHLHAKFTEMQKNNPTITKKDVLDAYVQENKPMIPIVQALFVEDLQFRAQVRIRSRIASSEEKEVGEAWEPVLQEYMNKVQTEKTEDTKSGMQDIEKYIK
ncbi:MAG TPA: hypothetical protein VGW78_06335 [Candidatus Babeliales bacterium]|jgi:hypothetical protein|nr:hypothetical protein [Candidatus Babeliales bacterium]